MFVFFINLRLFLFYFSFMHSVLLVLWFWEQCLIVYKLYNFSFLFFLHAFCIESIVILRTVSYIIVYIDMYLDTGLAFVCWYISIYLWILYCLLFITPTRNFWCASQTVTLDSSKWYKIADVKLVCQRRLG